MTRVYACRKLFIAVEKPTKRKVGGMAGASNEPEPFITAKEAADYTGYKLGSIYGMVHRGEIPFHRRGVGVGLRFLRSELDAWLKGDTRDGAA